MSKSYRRAEYCSLLSSGLGITYAAAAFVCLSLVSPASYAINPDLVNIPDNTWVKVESGGLTAPAGILGYSGMAYDSVNGKLLVFGGGHNDYWGNEVWAFDTDTAIWQRMYEPDPASDYVISNYLESEPGKLQSSGRPLSRHTYDNIEFISHAGVMVTFNGFTVDSATTGIPLDQSIGMLYPPDTWTYSFNDNAWSYRRNTPDLLWQAGSAAYDESTGLVVVSVSSDINPLARTLVYDFDNDKWTEMYPAQQQPDALETAMEYDSKRQVVYFFGGEWGDKPANEIWRYKTTRNEWTNLGAGGDTPPSAGGWGLAYDRANDVLVAFRGSAGTWIYNPTTNNWTDQNPLSGEPVHSADRIHGNLKYDPVNNVTWLVTYNSNRTIETWAYRYGQAVVDTTKPSLPTGIQVQAQGSDAMRITWSAASDAESGIARYKIYRDGIFAGSATQLAFTDSGLTEATTYRYAVSAVNGAGLESALSAEVSASTAVDNVPPSLASVDTSGANNRITVVFSEPVQESGANLAENYTILPGIAVTGASLGVDLQTVTLTISPLLVDQPYKLIVQNIYDRAQTANLISPTANQLEFSYQLILEPIGTNPASYNWDVLVPGTDVYVDRSGTIVWETIPSHYHGVKFLQTANDDKSLTGENLVSFYVNQAVTVYVAYDVRNTSLATWLQDWTATGESLSSNDTSFNLYKKTFAAGTISLGGNGHSNSMYSVFVIPTNSTGNSNDDVVSGGDTTSGGLTESGSTGGGGVDFFLSILLFLALVRATGHRRCFPGS